MERTLQDARVNEMTFEQLRKLYWQVQAQETSLLETQRSTSSTLEELKLLKQKLGELIRDSALSGSSFSREIPEQARPGADSTLMVRDQYNEEWHTEKPAVQKVPALQHTIVRDGNKVSLKRQATGGATN